MKYLKKQDAFTLIHLVFLLIAFSVASGVVVKVVQNSVYESRKTRSIEKILEIQRAIFGDYRLRDRTDYGFVGDFGRVPDNLDELLIRPPTGGEHDYWDGPYLSPEFLEDESDPFLDAWGNPFVYDITTGSLSISTESIGDDIVVIPSPVEDTGEMITGGLSGSIVDKLGRPPKKGDRRHFLITMVPIVTDPWPTISYNITTDMGLLHLDHIGGATGQTEWDVIHVFTDVMDQGRDHWSDGWVWLPEGTVSDILDNTVDDHLEEYDEFGVQRLFDPHYTDESEVRYVRNDYRDEYNAIQVFIHPDRYGYYEASGITARPYIITCYYDYTPTSIKRYVIIKPNVTAEVNFTFDLEFPWYDEPPPPTGDMASYLTVTGSDLIIDGYSDMDISVGNSGPSQITISQIAVSWSSPSGPEKIQSLAIDGIVRWTGNKGSGNTLDIDDTGIPVGTTDYAVLFSFSRDLAGKQLSLTFFMADGSQIDVTSLPVSNE